MEPTERLLANSIGESITRTEALIEKQHGLVAQATPTQADEKKILKQLVKALEDLKRFHHSLITETKTSALAVTNPRPRILLPNDPILPGTRRHSKASTTEIRVS